MINNMKKGRAVAVILSATMAFSICADSGIVFASQGNTNEKGVIAYSSENTNDKPVKINGMISGKAMEEVTAGVTGTEQITTEHESEEVTTEKPTTEKPTTQQPTTEQPTTQQPTTETPTTEKPTTLPQTTKPAKIIAWCEYKGNYYNDKKQKVKGAISKGIDVSVYQGAIDWAKVKKTDIDFAIIRCGYGGNYTYQDDKYFVRNIKECEKYGIPYGIYIYSYATNKKMMKSEVQHVLRLIKKTKAKPSFPVYLDMEDNVQYVLSNKKLGDLAEYFCDSMINAGYETGVYANLNWWTYKLTDKRFNRYHRWVARYNSVCGYPGQYQLWQFSSLIKVSGIAGTVDTNFLYALPCDNISHNGKWKTTKKATVLSKGTKKYICSRCGHVIKIKYTSKLKATGKLNKTYVKLKKGKTFKIRVRKMANGDGVKSYKSSNKKIAIVSKKGKVTALRKKGVAKITVKLKSGKKLKLSVRVK